MHIIALRTFPAAGEPAVEHERIAVTSEGLAGDRRKKAPLSLSGEDVPRGRSNIVLSGPTAEVEALIGSVVQVGEVVLLVEASSSRCEVVYAVVGEPGEVAVGDRVTVVD